ncbi:MAG: hypothetical protein LBH25_15225, partial [Fibromonadaceae bacterium]|nr:hypothetical protein [Fibromonadaceae bacterium]
MRLRFLAMMLMGTFSLSFGGNIEVHSRLASGSLFSSEISLHLRIHNNSSERLDLAKANLTYRFSDASSPDRFAYDIWHFSAGSSSDAKISFHELDAKEKLFKLYFAGGEVAIGGYAEIQLSV